MNKLVLYDASRRCIYAAVLLSYLVIFLFIVNIF